MKHLNIFVYKKYQSSKLNIPNEYLYDKSKDSEGNVRTDQIRRISDGAWIPFDPLNRDYQDYLAWVAEGNTAADAD